MTGLLSRSNKGRPLANSPGGGWSDDKINRFLNDEVPNTWRSTETEGKEGTERKTMTRVGSFDAVIFRVMHGWMNHKHITHDRLVEAIELSHELFGAKTVILMNTPFTNNVKTMEDYLAVQMINLDIQYIASKWHLRVGGNGDGGRKGVEHVLVQDYDTFHKHVIWSNAHHVITMFRFHTHCHLGGLMTKLFFLID